MLSNDYTYKKLYWRVEAYKIIAELRTLTYLKRAPRNDTVAAGSLCSFAGSFGDLPKRIENIINAIDQGLVNLNATDDSSDDLYEEVRELYGRFRNDASSIRKLENSLLYLTLACPNSKPLSVELIEFIETTGVEFSNKKTIMRQIKKMLEKTPHIEDSPIEEYLTMTIHDDIWYDAFLFESGYTSEEEITPFFNTVLMAISEGKVATSSESLKKLVRKFVKSGAELKYETLLFLLTTPIAHQEYVHDALLEIGFNTSKYQFNLEDAFKEAFHSLENIDRTITMDSRTPKLLSGLFKFACDLKGISFASLIFSDLLLSHPQNDKLTDIITNFLSEYPHLLDIFNDTYILEKEKLEEERQKLVLVLSQIKSRKNT